MTKSFEELKPIVSFGIDFLSSRCVKLEHNYNYFISEAVDLPDKVKNAFINNKSKNEIHSMLNNWYTRLKLLFNEERYLTNPKNVSRLDAGKESYIKKLKLNSDQVNDYKNACCFDVLQKLMGRLEKLSKKREQKVCYHNAFI
jgi:hypothetical protein